MSARDPIANLVMAPVSPAVAKLLHKLQAQFIAENPVSAIPPGAAIVLPHSGPVNADIHYNERGGYRSITGYSYDGRSQRLQTPLCFDPAHPWDRPGVWYGSETRLDTEGRTWTSSLPARYVCDDFGQLVPIGGAA